MLFLNNEMTLLTIFKKYKVPLRILKNVFIFNSPNKKVNTSFDPLLAYIHYSRKVSQWGSPSLKGSMTLEASIILPFFLLAILSFFSFMEMLEFQNGITMALRDAGMTMGAYGYAYEYMVEGGEIDLGGIVPNVALSYGYTGKHVEDFLGLHYMDGAEKDLGLSTIHYYNSSIMEENDVIDLVATFSMEPRFNLLGLPKVNMIGRYYGRAWTGYHPGGESAEIQPEKNVYVTQDGEVYHLSRYCSHLQITIMSCTDENVHSKRNEDGESYRACLFCGYQKKKGKYYITSDGDCFHKDINCSGLKRTIDVVPLSAVQGRAACSRCGG